MMMTEQPDKIVFRLPDDENGDKQFLEAAVDADGVLSEDARCFATLKDDSYNLLKFNEIVLAKNKGDYSLELARVELFHSSTGEPVELWTDMFEIHVMMPGLILEFQQQSYLQ